MMRRLTIERLHFLYAEREIALTAAAEAVERRYRPAINLVAEELNRETLR